MKTRTTHIAFTALCCALMCAGGCATAQQHGVQSPYPVRQMYDAYIAHAPIETLVNKADEIARAHASPKERVVELVPEDAFGDLFPVMQNAWAPWGGVKRARLQMISETLGNLSIQLKNDGLSVSIWVQAKQTNFAPKPDAVPKLSASSPSAVYLYAHHNVKISQAFPGYIPVFDGENAFLQNNALRQVHEACTEFLDLNVLAEKALENMHALDVPGPRTPERFEDWFGEYEATPEVQHTFPLDPTEVFGELFSAMQNAFAPWGGIARVEMELTTARDRVAYLCINLKNDNIKIIIDNTPHKYYRDIGDIKEEPSWSVELLVQRCVNFVQLYRPRYIPYEPKPPTATENTNAKTKSKFPRLFPYMYKEYEREENNFEKSFASVDDKDAAIQSIIDLFATAYRGVTEDEIRKEFDDPFIKETVLNIRFSSDRPADEIIHHFKDEFARHGWKRTRHILHIEQKMCMTWVGVFAKGDKHVFVEIGVPHMAPEPDSVRHTGVTMKFHNCTVDDVFGKNALEKLEAAYKAYLMTLRNTGAWQSLSTGVESAL